MKKGDAIDPKGLISEAFRIEGIGYEECRSIYLDWALSLPLDADAREHSETLLNRHSIPDHPMTQVLKEGLGAARRARRRGGWKGRRC
ncbi:hypothetical protein [Marivita sp. GX14005]|uniref:hypothetical protein n=1 Tax=Marivita sp. GX14005 TaxID=2942276 RepID=UPI00201929CA|nr:hypothetical protein [Marivita sp. GX14005]